MIIGMPQTSFMAKMNRLFTSSNETKKAYLIALNSGYTSKDLDKCLNMHATLSNFFFDANLLASSGVGKVLATSSDCTRQITSAGLIVSDMTLTATDIGVPTHIILGTLFPIMLEIGVDANLAYPKTGVYADASGVATVIPCPGFTVPLTYNISESANYFIGDVVSIDSAAFVTGNTFYDYVGNTVTVGSKVAINNGGMEIRDASQPFLITAPAIVPSNSFTIDFKYKQGVTTKNASHAFITMVTAYADRIVIAMDNSNGILNIYTNNQNVSASFPAAATSTLRTTDFIDVKYVYDASSGVHSLYTGGVLRGSVTQVIATTTAKNLGFGGSGTYDSANKVVVDNIRFRQGVFL